jgi:uncharacterized membrane protein YoaK (UPF0700 family)
MSGNSTRLSVGVVDGAPYVGTVLALLASFVAGVIAGSLIGRHKQDDHVRRQVHILAIIAGVLWVAPLLASGGFLLAALCLAAFCMGLENTLFERDGSVSFGLTYMTGALVKIGQGLATFISGGARFDWMPYMLLWLGLVTGAACGAMLYGVFGVASLWAPAAYSALLAVTLRFSGRTSKR